MARPLRITAPDLVFHVIDRGNNRQLVFREDSDFEYFLKLLKKYKKKLKLKLYHYCLMSNHIHLMVEPTVEGSVSKFMMRLTLAYSVYFNKKYEGVGHVWQGRYKSSLIDKENYFIRCGLYVELNPVRAKLVLRPEKWLWSSYNFYASGKIDCLTDGLIDIEPYFLEMGDNFEDRRKRYKENIEGIMEEGFLRNIRRNLDEGIYGHDEFVREMKKKFKIKSLRNRGRPFGKKNGDKKK